MAFSLLPFVFVTLTFFDVTSVLVVTTFATVPTGDGTPEMILIGHCFPIFSALLPFQLQHTHRHNHCDGRSQGHDRVHPCH